MALKILVLPELSGASSPVTKLLLINFARSFESIMIEKLEEIKNRFEEVGQLLSQPDIVRDQKKYSQLGKEYRDLEKIVVKYKQYTQALNNQQQAKEVLEKEKDPDMREL